MDARQISCPFQSGSIELNSGIVLTRNNISMRGVFVTGTGTGVGKTIFAAGLAWALRQKNIDVGVMKPFATSDKIFSKRFKSSDTALLARAAAAKETDAELNPVFYRVAGAPLMAAAIANRPLPSIRGVLNTLRSVAARHEFIVAEGIGGVLVPLTSRHSVIDFIKLSGLPVVIVTTPFVGTINSTLLTVRMCLARGLRIAGLVISMMPRNPSRVEEATPKVLATISKVPVLGSIPRLSRADYILVGKIIQKEFDLEPLLSGK